MAFSLDVPAVADLIAEFGKPGCRRGNSSSGRDHRNNNYAMRDVKR